MNEKKRGLIAEVNDEDIVSFSEETKPNFNNGYIKANQEDITVGKTVYIKGDDEDYHEKIIEEVLNIADKYKAFVADDGCRYGLSSTYINKGQLSWDEPEDYSNDKQIINMKEYIQANSKGEKEDDDIIYDGEYVSRISSMCSTELETISIKSDDGTVYEFEKPKFECELIKVKGDDIIGLVCFHDGRGDIAIWWNKNTGYVEVNKNSNLCLTPIKPKQLTLKEILQDVQDKQMSVDASERLIRVIFKIDEED